MLRLHRKHCINHLTKEGQTMELGLGILTFGTLGFVVAAAYISARATEERRKSGARKSALSEDGIAERMGKMQPAK